MQESDNQKFIFLDIDGTIYSKMGVIPEHAKTAIEKAKEKGHKVFVSTGRSKAGLPKDILALPLDGYIASGGAYVEAEGEIIFNQYIEPEVLREVYQYLMVNEIAFTVENNELIYGTQEQIDIQRSIFEENINKQKEKYQRSLDNRIYEEATKRIDENYNVFIRLLTVVEDFHQVERVNKIMFRRSKISKEQMLREIGDFINLYPGSLDNLFLGSGEFYQKGINKAIGIQKILGHYGAEQKDTIAFGDGLNDLEMLQYVGTGVAMGNAVEELKQVADFTTKESYNDGLYYGFEACGII